MSAPIERRCYEPTPGADHVCIECETTHPDPDGSFCLRCGACRYRNSKQVWDRKEEPDGPEFCIVECTRCGERHWWD